MGITIYSLCPSIWALGMYGLKTLLDLLILRQGISSKMFLDKIKVLGTDLYWIGVMTWGAILIQNNANLQIGDDTHPQPKLLIVLLLAITAIVITSLERFEEKISAKNAIGIQKMGQTLIVCILVGIMILIGLSNFSMVFYIVGLSQQ